MITNWTGKAWGALRLGLVTLAALGWFVAALSLVSGRDAEVQRKIADLQSDRDQLQAKLLEQQESQTLVGLKDELRSARKDLETVRVERLSVLLQLGWTGSDLKAVKQAIQQRRQELSNAEDELLQHRGQLKDRRRELDQVHSKVAAVKDEQLRLAERLRTARREEEGTRRRIAELFDNEAALVQQLAQGRVRIQQARERVAAAQGELANTRTQSDQLRARMRRLADNGSQLRRAISQLSAERKTFAQQAEREQPTVQQHTAEGFWLAAEMSGDVKLLKRYLELYPNGGRAQKARATIAALERKLTSLPASERPPIPHPKPIISAKTRERVVAAPASKVPAQQTAKAVKQGKIAVKQGKIAAKQTSAPGKQTKQVSRVKGKVAVKQTSALGKQTKQVSRVTKARSKQKKPRARNSRSIQQVRRMPDPILQLFRMPFLPIVPFPFVP